MPQFKETKSLTYISWEFFRIPVNHRDSHNLQMEETLISSEPFQTYQITPRVHH